MNFPTLTLSELLSQATQPQKAAPPNTLLGLKLRPPAGGFTIEQPPALTPNGVGVGPSNQAAALLDAPMPPVRPAGLGDSTSDGIIDPSIVARQKGIAPQPALTADDLKGLIQYQVGGVAQAGKNYAPIFTAAQWGRG
jgi:hypothetical protein